MSFVPFPLCLGCTKNPIPTVGAKAPKPKGKRLETMYNNLILCTMHSKIFQITENRVDSENLLNEDTLTQGDGSYYDYCSNINDEDRKEMIDCLVNKVLPMGMFTLIGDDEMVYNGGVEEWKKKWVEAIHAKAELVDTENVMDWVGASYQLEKELENPLHTDFHFYLSEDNCQTYAEPSKELMKTVSTLEEGAHLYIGGVIDYHF